MKRVSLILCLATVSMSLTSCGLIGAVSRVGSSVLRMPGSILKSVTEAEAEEAQPAGTIQEEEIETARIATAPLD